MLFLTQGFKLQDASPLEIAVWIAAASLLFAFSLIFLPESGQGKLAAAEARAKTAAAAVHPLGFALDPVLALGLVIIALGRLAMSPINSFFTLYVTHFLHSDTASLLWALAAVAEVPALIVAGRLVGRIGSMRVIALATVAIALRLAIYALVPTLAGAVIGQLLHFFCYGLFLPAAVSFVSSRIPPERRAFGMALLTGVGIGLPGVIGSTIGGIILANGSYPTLFALATVPALLALAIYAVTRRSFGRL
jgi:PPP family 3-phenylpropionic acid transporter